MIVEKIKHFYIHIPFCPAKCSYCAFVSHVGSKRLVQPYVDALCVEVEEQVRHERMGALETVYFGGGTPSMLEPEQLAEILRTVQGAACLKENGEITIEAHPGTVDRARLKGFREAGANRISFGVESLNRGELLAVGRSYGIGEVGEALRQSRLAGFESLAIDLMYGLPGQTVFSWRQTLAEALDLGADHLSLYPLQIEPLTVFGRKVRERKLVVPDDDLVVEMYRVACEALSEADFEHYEFSNWARPGHACRHNRAYWLNDEYFAAGVGAHGYVKPWRTENMRGVKSYIETIKRGQSPVVHREHVDVETERREAVMLGMRLIREGVPLSGASVVKRRVMRLQDLELLRIDGGHMFIPEEAVPMANEVMAELV